MKGLLIAIGSETKGLPCNSFLFGRYRNLSAMDELPRCPF